MNAGHPAGTAGSLPNPNPNATAGGSGGARAGDHNNIGSNGNSRSSSGSDIASMGALTAAVGGGLGVGVAAPDGGVVSVCSLCNMRRADLRAPCGHKFHARCIYAMPINRCPVCDQEFPSDKSTNRHEGGLFILPIEPFSTDSGGASGGANVGGAAGETEDDGDDLGGRGADQQQQQQQLLNQQHSRTGRWHSFETMYAQRVVADFDAGTLPLCEGTKLGGLLCNILNCSPSRLSKKLKIGKKCFQPCPPRLMDAEHIAKHREAQKRLSDLEEMFLMAESRANRSSAEVLSGCMQKEWRERLVEHALAVNQRLKNAWDWNTSRKRAERRRAELSTDALNKLLQTIAPIQNQPAEPAVVNHLAPLFLVNHHNANNTSTSNSDGAAAAGSGGQSQQMHNSVLAQAMAHVLQSWQQGQCVPSSDLADPDLQPWQQGLQPPPPEAFPPLPASATQQHQDEQHQQRHGGLQPGPVASVHRGQGGQQALSPAGSTVDVKGFGEEQLTSLEQNLASLGYKNSMTIDAQDDMLDENPAKRACPSLDGSQGKNSSVGSNLDAAGNDATAAVSSSVVPSQQRTSVPTSALTDASSTKTPASWQSSAAAGGTDDGDGGGGGGGGSAASTKGGDGSVANGPTNNHPFEDFIANFLDQVPFEAVDVWVPLCDRDQEGSEVVLFHAGYFTNVKELEEWGHYSTNFSFRQGQGIPGRVFGSNQSEFHENVAKLDLSMFLRLNGARKIGIGTSFALPVVSRWGVTFVIVFYSRDTIQLDAEKKVYIENMVRGWELDATVDTADSPKDGSINSNADAATVAAVDRRVAAKPRAQSKSHSHSHSHSQPQPLPSGTPKTEL
eukprot:g18019.t1